MMAERCDCAYVLSTYLSPPASMAFTALRHDQSVALWRLDDVSITLVRYWELERVSGMKHHELPLYERESALAEAVSALLGQEGLTLTDVDEVWGTPGLGSGRLPLACGRTGLPVHSLAHLFSSLCVDQRRFRDSTIIAMAMDGGPDYTLDDGVVGDDWYAGAVSRRGDLTIVPIESPGPLWGAAAARFGKEPGTLMALATASSVRVDYDVAGLLTRRYRGGRRLMGLVDDIVRSIAEAAESAIAGERPGFSREELVASATMKVIQTASIAIVRRNVDALLERAAVAPEDAFLALSGGYALNCPTNSFLIDHYGFRGLLAPPCVNDAGQALGIGLLGFHGRGDLAARDLDLRLPFVGTPHLDVPAAVRRWGPGIADVQDFDERTFVEDLRAGPVAWVDGEAEVGPRALGHRSLLGDPRSMAAKETLNRVKQRQWWRPVAPIVLEEFVRDWFVGGRPSKFMLETFPVAPDRRELVPAIVHLDDSARIQTLAAADEPFLYAAIRAFFEATGVPIVCNTSLNDRGEPIVDDASQALNFCFRKGIAIAYVGRRRFLLDLERGAARASGPEPRPLAALYAGQCRRPEAIYGAAVDAETMFLLYFWPGLRELAGTEEGASRLRSIARTIARRDPTFEDRSRRFLAYWRDMLEGRTAHGQVDVC
jgi:predicted NodU family carbamoyl transferase